MGVAAPYSGAMALIWMLLVCPNGVGNTLLVCYGAHWSCKEHTQVVYTFSRLLCFILCFVTIYSYVGMRSPRPSCGLDKRRSRVGHGRRCHREKKPNNGERVYGKIEQRDEFMKCDLVPIPLLTSYSCATFFSTLTGDSPRRSIPSGRYGSARLFAEPAGVCRGYCRL